MLNRKIFSLVIFIVFIVSRPSKKFMHNEDVTKVGGKSNSKNRIAELVYSF